MFKAFLEGVETADIRDGLSIELESSCTLGLLRFGKLRMWLDLRDHWRDFMATSGLVKHLIENPFEVYKQEAEHPTPEEVETAEAYCPIPYDGSQLEAVLAAGKGRSFVLQQHLLWCGSSSPPRTHPSSPSPPSSCPPLPA